MADFNVANLTVGLFEINNKQHLYNQQNGEHIVTPITQVLDNPGQETASKTQDFATNIANPNYNAYLAANVGATVTSFADGETYDSPNFLYYTDGGINGNQWSTKINNGNNAAGQAPMAYSVQGTPVGVNLTNWVPFSVGNLGRDKRLITNNGVNQTRYSLQFPRVAGWQTVIDMVYRTHEDTAWWPFLFSLDNATGTTTHPGMGFFRNNSDTEMRPKYATSTAKNASTEGTAVTTANMDQWNSYRMVVNTAGTNVRLYQNATQLYNLNTAFAVDRLHIGNQNTGQNSLRWELDCLCIWMAPNTTTVGATTGLANETCFGRSAATATAGVYTAQIPEIEFRDMYQKSFWVPQFTRGNVTAHYIKTRGPGNVGVSTDNFNKDLSATTNGAWYKVFETEDTN